MIIPIGRAFLAIAVLALYLSSCTILEAPEDKVVLTVGKRKITAEALKKDIERMTLEMGISDLRAPDLVDPLLKQIIDRHLILEYGREKGINIPDDQLAAAVKEIRRDYSEEDFQKVFLQEYIDFEEWKERLREQLLLKKIIAKASEKMGPVPFEEIKAYFDSHEKQFVSPPRIRLRQIVVKTREEAERLLALLGGGADMAKIAGEYSVAPEAESGGEIGWVAKGDLEDRMEKVVFSLPVGKRSAVTKTPYGYHIFEVMGRSPGGQKSLPEAMEEIEAILMVQKEASFYTGWLEALRDMFPVEVDHQSIESMEFG